MRPPKRAREPLRDPPEHAKAPRETLQDTPGALRDPPEHAKAPQETPQDPPGDPQETPKAPQGSLMSLGWVSRSRPMVVDLDTAHVKIHQG